MQIYVFWTTKWCPESLYTYVWIWIYVKIYSIHRYEGPSASHSNECTEETEGERKREIGKKNLSKWVYCVSSKRVDCSILLIHIIYVKFRTDVIYLFYCTFINIKLIIDTNKYIYIKIHILEPRIYKTCVCVCVSLEKARNIGYLCKQSISADIIIIIYTACYIILVVLWWIQHNRKNIF